MKMDELREAHFYLLEAFDDLQRARKHLSVSGVDSFSYFEDKIKRMQNSLRHLLEAVINRMRPDQVLRDVNQMKSITFPAMDIPAETKLKRTLDTIKEYMNFDIKIETMTVMKVSFPDEREDAALVLNSIKKCLEEKFGAL